MTRVGRALLAAALLSGSAARAADAPVVSLSLEACPTLDEARLRELLGIELATVRPAGMGPVDVRVACDGARVSVDLRAGAGPARHADVDLSSTPEAARLRSLVLAVTEQWSLPREEPAASAPASVAPPAAPAIVVAQAPPAPSPPPAWRLSAKATLRAAGKPGIWLGGVGVGIELALARHLGVAFEVGGEQGGLDAAVASVGVRDLVASLGVVAGAEAGRWSFAAVPAFEVGAASLSATARAPGAQGAALDAVWAGPALTARARRAIGRAAFVVAEAGAGETTRRVVGLVDQATPLFELRGPWFTLGVGAGLTF